MLTEDWSFETQRLSVADWHAQTEGSPSGTSLAEIVRGLLVPNVTDTLPESWQGPYTEQRTLNWIRDRDAEGTQLLAASLESREPVALVFLHQTWHASSARSELRLGYLVAESQWGKGFGTELVRGVVAWASARPIGSIIAGVLAANAPSIRVLEKCGFTRIQGERVSCTELFYSIDLAASSGSVVVDSGGDLPPDLPPRTL